MPRYIDADRLMTKIHELYVQPNIELWQVVKCVGNSPTADVVPWSEVEKLKDEIDRLKYNLKAVIEEIPETKREVAREIFAEIEKHILENCCVTDDDVDGIWKHIAELNKKYTEETDERNKQ
jgi:hypothetical protein